MTIGAFLRARVPALAWLPAYDRQLAARRCGRGRDHRLGDHPEGDGLRCARRPGRAGRPVHGAAADGGIRRPRQLPAPQRQHHDHHRHPDRRGDQSASRRARPRTRPPRSRRHSRCSSGVILVLAAVFRLGFVAQFISEPVLTGFKAGIGLVIIVDQAPKLFGLHVPKGTVLHTAVGAGGGPAALVTAHTHLVGRDDRADAAARPVRAACARAAARRGARHRGIGAAWA